MPRTAKKSEAGMSISELPLKVRMRLEHAGRWIAWSKDLTEFVAAADDPESVHEAVRKAGVANVVYEWVPPMPIWTNDPRD